jgi:hypothetical protein
LVVATVLVEYCGSVWNAAAFTVEGRGDAGKLDEAVSQMGEVEVGAEPSVV